MRLCALWAATLARASAERYCVPRMHACCLALKTDTTNIKALSGIPAFARA